MTRVLSKSKRNRCLIKLITWLYDSRFFWLSFNANGLTYFLISAVHNTTSKHDDHEVMYIKNCAKTEVYHATGCLEVADHDDVISFDGSMCYCITDECNNNFDANKNSNAPCVITNVITVVVALVVLMVFNK